MGCGICRYLAAVSIFIAVGLSLTAVTSSNWSEYYQDKNTTNQLFDTNLMVKATKGLWKLCAVRGTQRGCWNVNVGLKIATKRGVETDQPYWKICQASEVLAVITSIIAFILWTCCFTCSKNGTAKSCSIIPSGGSDSLDSEGEAISGTLLNLLVFLVPVCCGHSWMCGSLGFHIRSNFPTSNGLPPSIAISLNVFRSKR